LTSGALGARHHQVRRLRALNRDRQARAAEAAFVLEGPRLVAAVLDRHRTLEAVYFGYRARAAFAPLAERLDAAGVATHDLKEGVLEKIGVTRTPQPVLGVAPIPAVHLETVAPTGDVLVAVDVGDPGNLGAMVRSAEAAGVAAVLVTGASVDPYNPKAVRASAGALVGVPIVGVADPVAGLDALGATGRRRLGTAARSGRPLTDADAATPVAVVVGNEARGLDRRLEDHLEGVVTIPMHGDAESLNVAMAATVVLFDLDRRRAAAGAEAPA
jgi:TrmH family RNA methyltransferase